MQEYIVTEQDMERVRAHMRRIEAQERAAREDLERQFVNLHREIHGTDLLPSECDTCQENRR